MDVVNAKQTLLYTGLTTLAGVICISISAIGLVWFQTSLFFEMFEPDGFYFSAFSFTGVVLLVVFSSSGVTLLYSGVSGLMRLWNNNITLCVYGSAGVVLFLIGCLGMVWGSHIMQCFGVFCLDTERYVRVNDKRPFKSYGFKAALGCAIFFSLVPMSLVMLVQVVIKAIGLDRRWLSPNKQRVSIRREFPVVYSVVAFVLLVCFALFTMYYSNAWMFITPEWAAIRAQLRVTSNYTLCKDEPTVYTCPELPWSWVFTRNWVWSDSLVLKLYPSNIFFFSYLLIVLLSVTVIRGCRGGRSLLKRRCPSVLRRFSYGEAAFAVLTVLMLSLFFAYWVGGHNYKCRYDGVKDGTSVTDRWARSLGQLAVAFMSLCLFPASRYSVLHTVLGTSWEASLWVHKVLGYGMILATVAHMVAWYVRYAELGILQQSIFTLVPIFPTGHADNFTVPLLSLVTWFVLIPMGVLSLEPVRRRFFEVFYYMHLVGFYMIVPCVLWHAAAAWEYLLPGLTVWFVDRMVRMYRSASTAEVVSAVQNGAYVQIRFRHSTLCAGPGQYAFVNIPELSLLQWHPFSLSVSREGCYAFHIKSMGEGTWTGQLVQLVKDRGSEFALSVDGPCGRLQDFADYKSIVLVAGGIGVTPCASIYSYLRRQRSLTGKGPTVTLLWSLRDAELLDMMSHIWGDFDTAKGLSFDDPSSFPIKLFIGFTVSCDGVSLGGNVKVVRDRISNDFDLDTVLSNYDARDVLVFVGAPESLVCDVREACSDRGVRCREEMFLF